MERILNIVVSILMWFVIGVCVFRVFISGGVKISKEKLPKWLTCETHHYSGEEVVRRDYINVAGVALGIRLIMSLVAAFIMIFFINNGNEPFSMDAYLNGWIRWDARHYLGLAQDGYMGYVEDGRPIFLVFFPLYPFLIRLVHYIIPDIRVAALIVSTCSFIIGCIYVFALTASLYNKEIAYKTVFFLAIFPFSFYFGGIMTESTFFMCIAAGLYYVHKRDWLGMAVAGMFATLARMQGIMLLIPIIIVWWEQSQPIKQIREKLWLKMLRNFGKVCMTLMGIGIGGISYLMLNWKVAGNPLMFLTYEKEHWSQQSQYFGKTIGKMWDWATGNLDVMNDELKFAIWWPSLIIFCLALILLLYGMNKHNESYILFLATCTIMNYSLSWLLSASRYMSVSIPMFMILGELAYSHKRLEKWITMISLVFLTLYFTGYLMGRQIM